METNLHPAASIVVLSHWLEAKARTGRAAFIALASNDLDPYRRHRATLYSRTPAVHIGKVQATRFKRIQARHDGAVEHEKYDWYLEQNQKLDEGGAECTPVSLK